VIGGSRMTGKEGEEGKRRRRRRWWWYLQLVRNDEALNCPGKKT
jgi:hypothetical protein